MKNLFSKLLVMSIAGTMLFSGCAKNPDVDGEAGSTKQTAVAKEEESAASLITDYNWQSAMDKSLIVCETDGTFKYYQSAENMTDNYYGGTYEFYMGEEAVAYITTTLSDYGVTKEELEGVFANNEEYEEANLVCFILHNEVCIIDGVNQVENPYDTPYFGFCLEEEGAICLDIANMNTGNSFMYIAQ